MEKVIIFDFDGVFYSGKHIFKNVSSYVERNRRKFLPHLTDEEYAKLEKEENGWMKAVFGIELTTEIMRLKNKYPEYEISTADFWQVQEDEVYDIDMTGAHFVNAKFIEKLCKENSCYIVSNSSYSHIYHYMKMLNVDPEWFKKIFSNKFEEFDISKKHYYIEICEMEGVDPKEVYVFGDNDNSDLAPAREIGATATLVKDSHKLEWLVAEAFKDKNN